MKIELIAHTPDPELIIANAARTCYDSAQKDLESSRKMIRAIVKSGHESCVEHATATFRISEVSRVLTHELVRHRIGTAFSQRSQRYVDENIPNFVIPKEIEENAQAKNEFLTAMNNAWKSYKRLQDMGLKNQIARYVLPNACSTEIVVTMDFRAWRHFLKLRLSMRAQPEIRDLAFMLLDKLYEIAPSCFEDLKDGTSVQRT